MDTLLMSSWLIIQLFFFQGLAMPLVLRLIGFIRTSKPSGPESFDSGPAESDYAIIVTAYGQSAQIPMVVNSLLKLDYGQFMIYVVADNCDVSRLEVDSGQVRLLTPDHVLASNVKSHAYAISSFVRNHDRVVIIDSDNLVEPGFLSEMDRMFANGYRAVQGVRRAKNLNTTYARLDEAGDIFYRYIDRKLLFEAGSSAALCGSGMAFDIRLYRSFIADYQLEGAGFDKLLQYEIVGRGQRIGFAEKAIVYDEKTAATDQLVKQRARWINTWFRFWMLGARLIVQSIRERNTNQFLFSLMLLRPPLFILVGFVAIALLVNILFYPWLLVAMCFAGLTFACTFIVALRYFQADRAIFRALFNIPVFIFLQIQALFKSKKANTLSVATEHYYGTEKSGDRIGQ